MGNLESGSFTGVDVFPQFIKMTEVFKNVLVNFSG